LGGSKEEGGEMSKFKVGDRVRIVSARKAAHHGREFVIDHSEGVYDGEPSWCGGQHSPSSPYRWRESELELVTTSPVRTVTRKEIVSGQFGKVTVRSLKGVSDRHVGIGVHGNSLPNASMDSTELRAAAATFIELADALDEVA
jgi:hypothetical protein